MAPDDMTSAASRRHWHVLSSYARTAFLVIRSGRKLTRGRGDRTHDYVL